MNARPTDPDRGPVDPSGAARDPNGQPDGPNGERADSNRGPDGTNCEPDGPHRQPPGRFESLRWRVLRWCEVPDAWWRCWERLRGCQPRFLPPFFSPRFADAVERSRGDVWLAVGQRARSTTTVSEGGDRTVDAAVDPEGILDEGSIVAFFPFHRSGAIGVPVGRFLNDAHDVVRPPGLKIDWLELADACGVAAWDLHALPLPSLELVQRHRLRSVRSFSSDLGDDSESFLKRLQQEHRTLAKQPQKSRKLGREVGPLRLEVDCRRRDVLHRAVEWKRQQYRRTYILDLFLPDWTRRLVEQLHQPADWPDRGESFALDRTPLRGLLSVLWAGDEVVAAHVGMIEQGRLHYWFPSYDPAFGRYSPGTALYTELVRSGTSVGIHQIDMGYGEQPYKEKQTSLTTAYGRGRMTDSRRLRWQYEMATGSQAVAKRLPMKHWAKRIWRSCRPEAGIGKLR